MDVEILRKRSRLQTQGRDEGRKGWCPLLSFVLVVCCLWSKAASPVCCHPTCLYSVYLFLPLSVLPLAFCCFFCHPPITRSPFSALEERGKKRVFCTPGEIYCLWNPFMVSSAPLNGPFTSAPDNTDEPLLKCVGSFFVFFYSSWGRWCPLNIKDRGNTTPGSTDLQGRDSLDSQKQHKTLLAEQSCVLHSMKETALQTPKL